jgi:hypothetical protein
MHGGSSYGGIASPSLKHGWYSTYFPYPYLWARIEARERAARRLAKRFAESGLDDPMHRGVPLGNNGVDGPGMDE